MNNKLRIALKVIGLFALAVFIQSVAIPFLGSILTGAIELNIYFGVALMLLLPLAIGGWLLYREYKQADEGNKQK